MIPVLTGNVEGEFGTPNKIVYNSTPSITINDPALPITDTYLVEDVTIQPSLDSSIEPNPDRDGATDGPPRETHKIIVIRGWVKGLTFNAIYEKVVALNRAFNPVLEYQDDASTTNAGFMALDFDVPTSDTVTWPAGVIHCRYYARSIALPVPLMTKWDNLNARFVIQLRAIDPRRYEQTQQSVNVTGNSALTLNNSKATYNSYPNITLNINTQPVVDFSLKYNGVQVIFFSKTNFSGHSSITIDCYARTAQWNDGSDATSAIKSGSTFFSVTHAVAQDVQLVSAPTDMNMVVTWRRAFV